MTNADVARCFDIVWAGGEGLTTYVGHSVLSQDTPLRKQRAREVYRVPERSKYDPAIWEAAAALRQDGFSFKVIAMRLEVPLKTVYRMVQVGKVDGRDARAPGGGAGHTEQGMPRLSVPGCGTDRPLSSRPSTV